MASEFAVERYRYVLEQKRRLNEATFKIASVYQVFIVAVGAGYYTLVKDVTAQDISEASYRAGVLALLLANVFVSAITVSLLVGGIASWLSYKQEEAETLGKDLGIDDRPHLIRRLLSWYETYIILAVLCGLIGHSVIIWQGIPR
ncbi:hypothetical protein LK533_14110 [Sphingomonas sp. PL-96]|uniref:hypothetical protein n=1 Tax=Sphingomonas sp. PL-96 TaxID=2887201 RepID=UPI001E4FED1D|nr:hypothetical protein [Sphingomonas sp. PL-96]MCC2977806.1 hypothetical protein [Sphingomonas sp. PL-96]